MPNSTQNTPACYRVIKRYKYQLREEFHYMTPFKDYDIDYKFIRLKPDGTMIIQKNYAWDGASGPTRDTKNSIRASLVHDAFYQLSRKQQIPFSSDNVQKMDKFFRDLLVKDGMSRLRAQTWYWGLRLANGFAARPKSDEEERDKLICAP